MKTIKIICLFAFFLAALYSCENEDGEVCYPANELGHDTANVATDSTANSQVNGQYTEY